MKIHAFDILLKTARLPDLPQVVFLVGEDGFLRQQAASRILGAAGLEIDQIRNFDGQECSWGQVRDELASFSLFDARARRVAVVKSAGTLLKDLGESEAGEASGRERQRSDYREQIERWCDSPAEKSLLVMHFNTLPANTRLYKIVDKRGWIVACGLPTTSPQSKSPDLKRLEQWIGQWAGIELGLHLETAQISLILDAIGPNCGLLHQELAKLSLYADAEGKLDDATIRQNVGSWATRTVWQISDAIMDGRIAQALEQLDHLFGSGESPQAVVPQISWSLRRYGVAAQLVLQSRRLGRPRTADQVAGEAGFWGPDLRLAPQRLRRLGLKRASKILAWLLELDLKLKGSHSNHDRAVFALEEFCMRFL